MDCSTFRVIFNCTVTLLCIHGTCLLDCVGAIIGASEPGLYDWYISCVHLILYTCFNEGRKNEASKVKQTKQHMHSTPKAVTFPKKNELPRVGHVLLI